MNTLLSNGKRRCSITENLEPREPFAYCPRIYRLSFSSSFTRPLFLSLSRSSRSLDTYINYTIVLHSCTCSVEIHARRLRRQAWSGIEKWFLNHLFSSFFSVCFCFTRLLPPFILLSFTVTHSPFLTLHRTTPDVFFFYLHLSTHRCLCVYVLRKKTHVIFIYIHVSRVCFCLKHSVWLAVCYTCFSSSPIPLEILLFL